MITSWFAPPDACALAQALKALLIRPRRRGEYEIGINSRGAVVSRHGNADVAAVVGAVNGAVGDWRDVGAVVIDGARWTVATFGWSNGERDTVVAFEGFAPEEVDEALEFAVPEGALWIAITRHLVPGGFYIKASIVD